MTYFWITNINGEFGFGGSSHEALRAHRGVSAVGAAVQGWQDAQKPPALLCILTNFNFAPILAVFLLTLR